MVPLCSTFSGEHQIIRKSDDQTDEEPDSGCDMMGMGNVRDIVTAIYRTVSIQCSGRLLRGKDCTLLMSTLDETVLGSRVPCLSLKGSEYPLKPYNHEEFDTKVMLHATNAVSRGYKSIHNMFIILLR